MIVRRQRKSVGSQLTFDDLGGWRFHAIVTNVPPLFCDIATIEHHHRLGGGPPEEAIRLLKHDFGMNHALLQSFFGNCYWWLAAGLADNIARWIRVLALPEEFSTCRGKRLRLSLSTSPHGSLVVGASSISGSPAHIPTREPSSLRWGNCGPCRPSPEPDDHDERHGRGDPAQERDRTAHRSPNTTTIALRRIRVRARHPQPLGLKPCSPRARRRMWRYALGPWWRRSLFWRGVLGAAGCARTPERRSFCRASSCACQCSCWREFVHARRRVTHPPGRSRDCHTACDTRRSVVIGDGQPEFPGLTDINTLAKPLGVGERCVRRMVSERRVTPVEAGRLVRFDLGDIRRWVEEQRRPPLA